MFYLVKTPGIIKKIYPSYLWNVKNPGKCLYLTFDDGPHPVATPFVLNQLKLYNAKATFFCIGKNVVAYPEIYQKILSEGHSTGNHTFNHLNGWKTKDDIYMKDVAEASKYIDSNLFRPPYGRIKSFHAKNLQAVLNSKKPTVVMWDVLSADFDISVSPQKCLENVILRSKSGSIIVFHDSEKAFTRLEYALPGVLKHFSNEGFVFHQL
jgi:peptidoglycan/xylan/chitin deacetylase (PgdA/CDA1 family)